MNSHPGINFITKALKDPLRIEKNSKIFFGGFTSEIDIKNVKIFNFSSLIQEKIEKEFEIRSFYLRGEFYSMAIFSQENGMTTIDFRNYDKTKPNRIVPFSLPQDVSTSLLEMSRELGIRCCSYDLILSSTNEFYFLELNPFGEFLGFSTPCNYNLDYEIAKYIKSEI